VERGSDKHRGRLDDQFKHEVSGMVRSGRTTHAEEWKVRKGGTVASTMNAADEAALNAAGLTGTKLMANPVQDVLAPLATQAADGRLRVEVATVLPLDQATDGLATLASGHAQGKIVITVTD
jgi:NADPH2:quinone reductase